ncbi:alkaline phosphatase D family protein [Pseudoalteromonas pernae]|uniref:alkaline phosphatase D family protein n=1 Tax=Pseudoalteromonas pernae TaxID=3118054 RepID=UPI00324223AC
MKKLLVSALFCASVGSSLSNITFAGENEHIERIRFGSCSHQSKPMPILDAIIKDQPELFIFLGDNIYGDTEDMALLKRKYQQLGEQPGIKALRAQTQTIAIWDDHDFGENDAGMEYPQKEASRQIMLDFWQEPQDSPRRTRKDGIYTSYEYGEGDKLVRVIMPDLRWNRPAINHVSHSEYALKRKPNNQGPYSPSEDATASMLGETQWQWLEAELKKPAAIRIIASSLQLLPEFTGWESWANYPYDRTRLLELIRQEQIAGVLMISGDTHWGELSKVEQTGAYPLWEVTSSGLTEKWKHVSPNEHRVGNFTNEVNYGFIDIDWQQPDPSVHFGLKDITGNTVIGKTVRLSQLQPNLL